MILRFVKLIANNYYFRADSASNISTDPVQENIAKLRDDYGNLLREVENLRVCKLSNESIVENA